jgi:hypothetical protein
MRRFKFALVLIVVASLAIGIAIVEFSGDRRQPKLDDPDRGGDVGAGRLSRPARSVGGKGGAADQSETAAILKQLAPDFPESGQTDRVEGPMSRKEPIRIKTH